MTSEKPAKAFSCVRCFERKVKCDKQQPCSACVRSKVECTFRVPSAPRRKKRRHQEEILLARLRHCEDLLQSKGIDLDALSKIRLSPERPEKETTNQPPSEPVQTPETTRWLNISPAEPHKPQIYSEGRLITDQGKTRFIENNLWTSVTEEFQEPKEAIDDSSDEEDDGTPGHDGIDFLFGLTPSSNVTQYLHPTSEHIFKLWYIFLENFNPLTKLIHRPTLEKSISKIASNVDNINKSLETLMFSIYGSAVLSMTDSDCETKFGEKRSTLLARYRHGTRLALARAKFLATSDMVILQAFVIYLLSMREEYDARTLWTLVGVAGRIAQSLGIHRDGTLIGLPPFETELRRRLWWQIAILDFRSAELTGSGRFADFSLFDTKAPSNVHDEDIWPGMKEPPVQRTQPTEMIACLLRCELGVFFKEKLTQGNVGEGDYSVIFERQPIWGNTLEDRDARINELEQRLEDKFLRYFDISVPIQFQAFMIGRSAVAGMRLMAHHPKRYPNEADVPEEERKLVWNLSLKLLEIDNFLHTSPALQRFLWHSKHYFQWQALIYLLGELKTHTLGEDVDKAWAQVAKAYDNHLDFITDYKRPLHVAVGSLCLKAYDARESALQQQQKSNNLSSLPIQPYEFILRLRLQRQALNQHRQSQSTPDVSPNNDNIEKSTPSTITNPYTSVDFSKDNITNQFQFQQPLPQPPISLPNQSHQQQPQQFLPTNRFSAQIGWDSPNAASSINLPFMQTYDTVDASFTPDFMIQDIGATDWSQWDSLIQNFDFSK